MKSRRPLGVTSREESLRPLSKEEWRERAIFAETKLSSIACIPNDSIGWVNLRRDKAREALREILKKIDKDLD
jgi:hypothetical protein